MKQVRDSKAAKSLTGTDSDMRLIETLTVGPRHAGHSRAIYVGNGHELWHEIIMPWNPLQPMTETAELFIAKLPETPPPGCKFCGLQAPYYGGDDIASIIWDGADALDQAIAYSKQHKGKI